MSLTGAAQRGDLGAEPGQLVLGLGGLLFLTPRPQRETHPHIPTTVPAMPSAFRGTVDSWNTEEKDLFGEEQ